MRLVRKAGTLPPTSNQVRVIEQELLARNIEPTNLVVNIEYDRDKLVVKIQDHERKFMARFKINAHFKFTKDDELALGMAAWTQWPGYGTHGALLKRYVNQSERPQEFEKHKKAVAKLKEAKCHGY